MAKQAIETGLENAADVVAQLPSNPDAPITTAQLLQLLSTMAQTQQQSQAVLATTLADAIVKAQQPYVDPKKDANDKMFRDQMRKQAENERINRIQNQKYCPHIAGCNGLSDFKDHLGRTCIIWHQLDSGETVGLCANCQREFRTTDDDFTRWQSMPSINKRSSGGQRDFYQAMMAARAKAPANVEA